MSPDFREFRSATDRQGRRPVHLRRSWLFLAGGAREPLMEGVSSGADVLIQELETTVVPNDRPAARALSAEVMPAWRGTEAVAAVRINPLDAGGYDDLAAVMGSAPDVVMMSMVRTAEQVTELAAEVARLEQDFGLELGSTELVPNIEDPLGIVNAYRIATADARVTACLLASEDMTASLGAVRSREGSELAYVRSRFLVECTAAGVLAIDYPYTFSDTEGLDRECSEGYRLGFRAKAGVARDQVPTINRALTPSPDEVAAAALVVAAFEADPTTQPVVDGRHLELPIYLNAKRLLERAREFGQL